MTQFVSDSGELPRADICRYLFLMERDTYYAHALWSLMSCSEPNYSTSGVRAR